MTQLALLISNYFTEASQVYAILNVVKTMAMCLIIVVGSNVVTMSDFRLYFLGMLILNIGFQALLTFTFKFKGATQLSESEMQKLITTTKE